jgi:hypothetical protein
LVRERVLARTMPGQEQAAQHRIVLPGMQQLRMVAQKIIGATGAVVVIEAQPVDDAEDIQVGRAQAVQVTTSDAARRRLRRVSSQVSQHEIHRAANVQ